MNITQKNLRIIDSITGMEYSLYPTLQTMNGKIISYAISYAKSDVLDSLYGLGSTNMLWIIDMYDLEIEGLEKHIFVYSKEIDECFWCLESDIGEIQFVDTLGDGDIL